MKKIMTAALLLGLVFSQTSCAKGEKERKAGQEKPARTLVAYFSATGNTKAVAERIASAVGADTWEIAPKEAYTAADLDWTDDSSRSSRENADTGARPELKAKMAAIDGYDVLYVGYPVWWGVAPRIILTFLESHNLDGKTVIPFCTSASSPLGESDVLLHKHAPKAGWKAGKRFSEHPSKGEVEEWARSAQPKGGQ